MSITAPRGNNVSWSFNNFASISYEPVLCSCENTDIEQISHSDIIISNIISDIGTGFINPSEECPVRTEYFLKYLDLTPITPYLKGLYGEEYRFKFPMDAMLKTLIYFKLKPYKFLTDLWNDLVATPNLADDLGFKEIPDYNTVYHFLTKRLNSKGTKRLLDAFVEANRQELLKHKITLGEEVVLDSCPIPAKKKDCEADWNGHYELWCYLWHNLRCINTGLPLNFHITNGREDELHFLSPFILKLKTMQHIDPIRVYIDGGYAGFENIARMYVYFDVDVVCNIAKDWKFSEKGTLVEICRRYNKLWKQPYYRPQADFEHIQYAMMMSDEPRFKQIGMHYRNNILSRYGECPDGYMDDYHFRNRVENTHGTEKRKTEIKNIEAKGIERTMTHIGMHLISLHAIALCRLQNGVTTGLTSLAGLV
jgi:hypothetical protein